MLLRDFTAKDYCVSIVSSSNYDVSAMDWECSCYYGYSIWLVGYSLSFSLDFAHFVEVLILHFVHELTYSIKLTGLLT